MEAISLSPDGQIWSALLLLPPTIFHSALTAGEPVTGNTLAGTLTCPRARERERETEDLWEKLIYFTLWKLSKAQFNLSQSLRRFLVYTDADLLFFLNHNSMHFTHGRNIYLYFFSLYFNWKLYFGCFVFADLLYCFHSNYIFPFLRKVWEDTAFAPWSYSYSLSLKSGVSWEKGCFGVSQIHLNLQSCSPWMHLKSF